MKTKLFLLLIILTFSLTACDVDTTVVKKNVSTTIEDTQETDEETVNEEPIVSEEPAEEPVESPAVALEPVTEIPVQKIPVAPTEPVVVLAPVVITPEPVVITPPVVVDPPVVVEPPVIVPPVINVFDAPANLRVVKNDTVKKEVTIAWDNKCDAEDGLIGFYLYVSENNGPWIKWTAMDATCTYVDYDHFLKAVPGEDYCSVQYKITAYRSKNEESAFSPILNPEAIGSIRFEMLTYENQFGATQADASSWAIYYFTDNDVITIPDQMSMKRIISGVDKAWVGWNAYAISNGAYFYSGDVYTIAQFKTHIVKTSLVLYPIFVK